MIYFTSFYLMFYSLSCPQRTRENEKAGRGRSNERGGGKEGRRKKRRERRRRNKKSFKAVYDVSE